MGEALAKTPMRVRTSCDACPIRERAVCSHCGEPELQALNSVKSYRSFSKGEDIITAGENSVFVASIVNGVIAMTKTLPDGRRQVVGLQFPSDFVGGALRDVPTYDAVAVTDVLLCQFDRKAFRQLLEETPALRNRLLEMTLDELDAAREWLALLGQKSAQEKVASFLLMIARRNRVTVDQNELTADLPITRAEIGEFLGLTLETVSRQLSKLKGAKLIDFKTTRRFSVPDVGALQEAAGDIVS
ncbi:MAG: Crp/Fnr family transcriptional regulator [Pseudomonadota bacterium]